VQAVPIKDGVYWVGVQDPDLRIFDIVMETKYGTSYNAYLVKGSKKTALIETVKAPFFDEYIKDLQKLVKLEEIDYLIMNHTEPDHAGSVEKLLELMPNLRIMGSQTALTFLQKITNRKFKSTPLTEKLKLDLGGKTLEFISAPFLHWPDSIFTYLREDRILFTCDAFGCHYADERIFNDLMDGDFTEAYQYYFDMILGPFKPYVREALEKIAPLDIDIICPGHGPVLRENLDYYLNLYRQWAAPAAAEGDERPKVVMAYVSAYGYTKMIADSIQEGVETVGDFNFKKFDLVDTPVVQVVEEIASADGLLIGSPTIVGDTLPNVWELLTSLSPITHGGKIAAAFGSYGWSGEAVPNIENRLNMLRMQVLPGIKINFKPSERELEEAFNFGMDFGRAVLTKKQDASLTKWRCLICGHIHTGAEPPAVCPACGVGGENFVKEVLEDEFSHDSQDTYIIIGGGAAGLAAAQAIRKRDKSGRIIMFSEERVRPYFRPALTAILNDDVPEDKFFIFPSSWYEENRVELRLETKIKAINTSERQVATAAGEVYKYDKLIIASGASNLLPAIPGVDKKGVFNLRNLADAQAIKEALKDARKAVIIGGGVLGLEAAWVLKKAGLQVTVVEIEDWLLPLSLDKGSAARLEEIVRSKNIRVVTGARQALIEGEERVNGVTLAGGETLSADLVFVAGGIRPNCELAKQAGIEVKQGIVVDERMRTSVSGVYAAGDVAELEGKIAGHWGAALQMGKVAGASAAGDWIEYKKPLESTLLKAFDMEIFSLGRVHESPEKLRVTEVNDAPARYYKKSFVQDGALIGEIIIAPKVDATEAFRQLNRDKSGKLKVNKWKCMVCGYIHEGPEPPEECPVCGAPGDMFEPLDE